MRSDHASECFACFSGAVGAMNDPSGGAQAGASYMPSVVGSLAIARARKLRRDMTDGGRKLCSELREFRRLYGLHALGLMEGMG